jgi:7-carboxy-7-deazaguanine synthase
LNFLKVSEIFYSVQGEGPSIGLPSVFLRLAICNLQCSWCDTKYSWDWKNYDYDKEVNEMPEEEVLKEILRYGCKRLVITGGEPMLQQKELAGLIAKLTKSDYAIEIETNGTILPAEELASSTIQWNVSPKLANSNNSRDAREIKECYEFFSKVPSAYFKYVVENQDDLSEIKSLVEKYNLSRERVILMPEARTDESLVEKSAWLVEACKAEGFRFSTRLQIALYGNQRAI